MATLNEQLAAIGKKIAKVLVRQNKNKDRLAKLDKINSKILLKKCFKRFCLEQKKKYLEAKTYDPTVNDIQLDILRIRQ